MAPALVCINAILVSRGHKVNSVSYQGLGAWKIAKQSQTAHGNCLPVFWRRTQNGDEKGGFAEFWSLRWKQVQCCIYSEHLRIDDITRACNLSSCTSQAVNVHTVIPLSGFITWVWLMLIFRKPVIVLLNAERNEEFAAFISSLFQWLISVLKCMPFLQFEAVELPFLCCLLRFYLLG